MKKLTDKDAKELVEKAKKEYSNLHYMLLVYKIEDTKQIRFTQTLESDAIDTIISILERNKSLLVNSLNKKLQKKVKIKKKK